MSVVAEAERTDASATGTHLKLAIIVPTFQESENVRPLIKALMTALSEINFEIIFVDDNSPDGTSDAVRSIARHNPRVRSIERIGRRGLSSACIEGIMATSAPVAVVIDGDMQHDETRIPEMLGKLEAEQLDLVIGSRYVEGGGFGDWSEDRKSASKFATNIAKLVTKVDLSDPMSGFFMIRTDVFRGLVPNLSATGFKILLDICASSPEPLKIGEVPFEFRSRARGESKMDSKVLLEFLELLLDKTVGKFGVPTKFLMFGMVGGLGVFVHMAVLTAMFKLVGQSFLVSQATATLVAMTFNFWLNNIFTHYDQRLSGWSWLMGWISFCLASSVGALANVGIAGYLFQTYETIWVVSALAGIMVGVVWNYAITSIFTWKKK